MMSLPHTIADHVLKNLREMSWKCKDCPRVHECEDQDGLVRYCAPMIEAAIVEKQRCRCPQPQPQPILESLVQ